MQAISPDSISVSAFFHLPLYVIGCRAQNAGPICTLQHYTQASLLDQLETTLSCMARSLHRVTAQRNGLHDRYTKRNSWRNHQLQHLLSPLFTRVDILCPPVYHFDRSRSSERFRPFGFQSITCLKKGDHYETVPVSHTLPYADSCLDSLSGRE